MGWLKKVAGKGGVLMKDEDNLVAVKPPEPLAGVNGAEGSPKLKKCTVAPAGGGGGEKVVVEGETMHKIYVLAT